MEALVEAEIGLLTGVTGDFRGIAREGRSTRRQVTVMRAEDWRAAEEELGSGLVWTTRRVNLMVERVRLPRRAGDHICLGTDVRLEITGECDPCRRMDEQHDGLMAALIPDWRGGVNTRVIVGGHIALGDAIRIEAV